MYCLSILPSSYYEVLLDLGKIYYSLNLRWLCCHNIDTPIHKNRWANPVLYETIDSFDIKSDDFLDPLTFSQIFVKQKYSLKNMASLQGILIKFYQFWQVWEEIFNQG